MSGPHLSGRDLSPLAVTTEEAEWLAALQEHVDTDEHVVRLGEEDLESEPVVSCDPDGTWRCGRYIGTLTFRGGSLEIGPRYGFDVIEQWLGAMVNVMIVPGTAAHRESAALIPRLLALVWCRELDRAARHGAPHLRERRLHRGLIVRGRLAVPETAAMRASGRPGVASVAAERSLQNDIARTLVCGQRALRQMNRGDWWMTERARELMPQLWKAVGTRPRLPRRRELARIRYTPIRRPYEGLVERSWRIARHGGYVGSAGDGEAEGLLLDVAELWEHFVLTCTRRAAPPGFQVVHGTREELGRPRFLLRSERKDRVGLGRLFPDVIVRDGTQTAAVIDAKYKSLHPRRPERPKGVQMSDAYQITGYLSALRADEGTWGMLAYPADPPQRGSPERQVPAEEEGPWATRLHDRVVIRRLPIDVEQCSELLGAALTATAVSSGPPESSDDAQPMESRAPDTEGD